MPLTVSPPPHKKTSFSVQNFIWYKIFALIPLVIVSIYFFGLPVLSHIIAGIFAAAAIEVVILRFLDQKITVNDGDVIFIGMITALVIPAGAPWWLPMLGSAFAVGFGKHIFGGIGSYSFNPVLAAWVFLSLAYSSYMTPISVPQLGVLSDLILETGAGYPIGVSPLLILIPGIYLVMRKYIEWRVPLSFFVTVFALAYLAGHLSYAFTGALVLGGLFLITDTATSPITKNGRIIYGFIAGVLVFIYGFFSDYVAGTFYGLLLANAFSAFIENNTYPKPFGAESFFRSKINKLLDKLGNVYYTKVLKDERIQ
ncbi:NQR2 and RnfD family protein [Methanohalobium evestigatum Z-7303]|uniref:NQR2 and RnfD family protein n=1 Tax=Methanohalobium evestigatum (strain ATCC BAA-1072 / DSM 3721 / NBRC 107634 / OCM 161 / Z-7303) TaxID=644295 RepID=D7EAC6_METEZ|nr:Rnf electron transport complex subunit RnfD [Methanohalobium evestigatum]ADI74797.1 NQR2 and RnfD family protein [Methanohalobium evestigatum Z-7303]